MSKQRMLSLLLVLSLVAAVSTTCGGVPGPVVGPATEESTEAPGPSPVVEEPVILRVAIPQMRMLGAGSTQLGMETLDGRLLMSLQEAASQLSENYAQDVRVETDIYELPIHTSGIQCFAPWLQPFDQYDAVLMDSNSALPAFRDGAFAPVPDESFQGYASGIYPALVDAFPDPQGNLAGVIQATRPVMIIYHPERMGAAAAQLQDTILFHELPGLIQEHPLGLTPFPGIGIALLKSTLPDLTFDLLLDPAIVDRIPSLFVDTLEECLVSGRDKGNIRSADQIQIAQMFREGVIDWVMADSTFLLALNQVEYSGPVGVARMPRESGGAAGAMGVAWMVPATSQNQKLAWDLIAHVVDSPAAIEWSLGNGMLPATQGGYETALSQGYDQQLLPANLEDRDLVWDDLHAITSDSRVWHLPAGLSAQQYDLLYQKASDLFHSVYGGEQTVREAIASWRDLLLTFQE